MDDLIKGSWIVNSVKHLEKFEPSAPELQFFDSTEAAGKAGLLLAKLTADSQEIVPGEKLRAFARVSGIRSTELQTIFGYLRREEKADFKVDSDGNITEAEVYCFSEEDALRTTARVFDKLPRSSEEDASLLSLDATFRLPHYQNELIDLIAKQGVSERVAEHTLRLQTNLELIGVAGEGSDQIYHNEYAFAENPEKVARAIRSLQPGQMDSVNDILKLIDDNPGFPLEVLQKKFPRDILDMMEGVGLFDSLSVESPHANATFVTTPQLRGVAIARPLLSADVFHKSKLLLSCLRFGEIKSTGWRGRIDSFTMMMNIVRKLVRGESVGPCTAIGQDYQLLEAQGVIKTTRGYGSTRYMILRQREVGQLVLQMLEYHIALPNIDGTISGLLDQPLTTFSSPELHRPSQAKLTRGTREASARLLNAIRT